MPAAPSALRGCNFMVTIAAAGYMLLNAATGDHAPGSVGPTKPNRQPDTAWEIHPIVEIAPKNN